MSIRLFIENIYFQKLPNKEINLNFKKEYIIFGNFVSFLIIILKLDFYINFIYIKININYIIINFIKI